MIGAEKQYSFQVVTCFASNNTNLIQYMQGTTHSGSVSSSNMWNKVSSICSSIMETCRFLTIRFLPTMLISIMNHIITNKHTHRERERDQE